MLFTGPDAGTPIAEIIAERLIRLAQTSVAVHSARSLAELLEQAAAGAAAIFHTPAVVVAEACDGGPVAAATAGPEAPVTLSPWRTGRHAPGLGFTLTVEPAADWDVVAWPDGAPVTVAVARTRSDRPAVQVAVPAAVQMPGSPVLSQLAHLVASAVEVQRAFEEEHRIAITLQRSLLPRELPAVPGVEFAVRYLPASVQTEVGGDFYELTMVDGQLLAAIGDVAGHSLHAATVMGELRHAIRAYAVDGHPPGAILERVNRMIEVLLPGETATVCLLRIDPRTGESLLANAGHLPPLISAPGGDVRLVAHRGTMLGVPAKRPADLRLRLDPGETLVLYTDGLVERRDTVIDAGIEALAACAGTVESDLERFCARLVEVLNPTRVDDDIALVALRRRA